MKKISKIFEPIGKIPYQVLLVLFVASAVFSIYEVRENNQHMIALRNAVYVADANNGDVNTALNNLRKYVYSHMNTNLSSGDNAIKPPIQLKNTYDNLKKAEQTRVDAANSQIYTDAQTYCQQVNSTDFSGRTRVPCITDYVTTHGEKVKVIPDALYKYDFISPSWSPDLAGWSIVLSAILFLAFITSFSINKLVEQDSIYKKPPRTIPGGFLAGNLLLAISARWSCWWGGRSWSRSATLRICVARCRRTVWPVWILSIVLLNSAYNFTVIFDVFPEG